MRPLTLFILALVLCVSSALTAQQSEPKASKEERHRERVAKELRIAPCKRYAVLRTFRPSTMQKDLDQAVAAGFCVVAGDVVNVILEKSSRKCEYRVVPGFTSNDFGKDFRAAVTDGFWMVPRSYSGEDVLMEKYEGPPTHRDYLMLGTYRFGTLQRELDEATAKGYELAEVYVHDIRNLVMEERSPDAPPRPHATC